MTPYCKLRVCQSVASLQVACLFKSLAGVLTSTSSCFIGHFVTHLLHYFLNDPYVQCRPCFPTAASTFEDCACSYFPENARFLGCFVAQVLVSWWLMGFCFSSLYNCTILHCSACTSAIFLTAICTQVLITCSTEFIHDDTCNFMFTLHFSFIMNFILFLNTQFFLKKRS